MNKIVNAKVAIKKPADIRGMGPDLLPGEWKFEAGKLYILIDINNGYIYL